MNKIHYVTGNAVTDPIAHATVNNPAIIAHICNNCGTWGAGFVLPLAEAFPNARQAYLDWHGAQRRSRGDGTPFALGQIQLVTTDKRHLHVVNMIAQDNTRKKGTVLVDYDALGKCLLRLGGFAQAINASVHMPRIGCGIGGGDWTEVEKLVQRHLVENFVDVWVYDLPKKLSSHLDTESHRPKTPGT